VFSGLPFAGTAQAGEVPFAPQDNAHPSASDGWQAGTCNVPPCTPVSPKIEFYETAAGHPPYGMTKFILKHHGTLVPGNEEPDVNLKDIRVDLPVGLSVNPGATPRCPYEAAHLEHVNKCPADTKVGESWVYVSDELGLLPPIEVKANVYNLDPKPGQPARFGFTVEAIPGVPAVPPSDIFLEADVAWDSDFHEGFTIAVPKVNFVKLLKNRLVFNGDKLAAGGQGFFLTTPSTCWNPNTDAAHQHTYSTYARGDSIE